MKTGGTSYNSFFYEHVRKNGHALPDTWDSTFEENARPSSEGPLRAISGHFLLRDVLLHFPESSIATMLRNPGQRVLSLYRFMASIPDHERMKMTEEDSRIALQAREMPLQDWLSKNWIRLRREVFNIYVYTMSSGYGDLLNRLNINLLIDAAKQNVENFSFVGITERMRDSIILTCLDNNINVFIEEPHLNITPSENIYNNKIFDDIDKYPFINHDWELYNIARKIFDFRLRRRITDALERIEARRPAPAFINTKENTERFSPMLLENDANIDRMIAFHQKSPSTAARPESPSATEFWLLLRPERIASLEIGFLAPPTGEVSALLDGQAMAMTRRDGGNLAFAPADHDKAPPEAGGRRKARHVKIASQPSEISFVEVVYA